MANNAELIKQCEERAQQWLTPAFDEETRKEVKAMLDADDKSALVDAFYQNLEFGTGGLRGIMGAGTNRMNKYIVGMATQGFANYIHKAFPGQEGLSVVVGHDCRNNSRLFAETVAAIFSANGIKAYLSRAFVLHLRFLSLSVSSAPRLVSTLLLLTTLRSTTATRLTGRMVLRCSLLTTLVSSRR